MPFGPRAAFLDAEAAPPSAEDFWGERAAAIHDALQAPANAHPDSGSGLAGTPGAAQPPRVDVAPGRSRKTIRGIPLANADSWIFAAVAAGVAIAAVVVIVFSSGISRPRAPSQRPGRSQVGFAAVLSDGVSNALRVARIDLSNLRGDTAVVRRAPASSVRRSPHVVRAPKPSRKVASPPRRPALSSSSASSSSIRTETPSSSTYPTTQTHDASNAPVSTHSDASSTYRSAPNGSGASSTNSSKTALRSLITGAGTCGCQ